MPASYPSSVVSLSTKTDGGVIFASHVNALQDEVIAIETALLNGFAHPLVPLTNNTSALGSSSKRWSKLWTQDLDLAGVLTLASGLTVPNGGTGAATLTNHGVLVGQGTSAIVATGTGTAGQFLASNGSGADPTFQTIPAVTVLDRSTTEQVIVSSAALTSVYSFSVPGGTLSTNKVLRFTLTGEWLNSVGSGQTIVFNAVFGATNITPTGAALTLADASTGMVKVEILINANGATNSQKAVALISVGNNSTSGAWAAAEQVLRLFHSTLAEDSTAAKTFDFKVQLQTSNANLSFKRWAALLELL